MAQPYAPLAICFSQHQGARNEQQDFLAISPPEWMAAKGVLAVLADGMGGMAKGALYGQIAAQGMLQRFQAAPVMEDPAAQLLDAYRAAHQEAVSRRQSENEGGATVMAVLIRGGFFSFLSSGDSRMYLWRRGKLLQLNREQALGRILDERAALGAISWEEADNNIRRNALYNHLGLTPQKALDRSLTPTRLLPGDRLALMSDGVFGTLESAELACWLGTPMSRAAGAVIGAVLARKKPRQDNCSVLLIQFSQTQR